MHMCMRLWLGFLMCTRYKQLDQLHNSFKEFWKGEFFERNKCCYLEGHQLWLYLNSILKWAQNLFIVDNPVLHSSIVLCLSLVLHQLYDFSLITKFWMLVSLNYGNLTGWYCSNHVWNGCHQYVYLMWFLISQAVTACLISLFVTSLDWTCVYF